jgi:hypothetical protein
MMSNPIQLKVSSRPTELDRKLGTTPSADQLQYLPWGTRSLKLAVTGDYAGPLRICPEPRDSDPERIISYASGEAGKAIEVSWGGGWENGAELEHKPGQTEYAYFNITHQGEAADDSYSLDVVARDKSGQELERKTVTLVRPTLPSVLLQPEWQVVGSGNQDLILRPSQPNAPAHVPLYLSRWWPEASVIYADPMLVRVPPLIRLHCTRNVGNGYSQVEVWGRRGAASAEVHLADIDGDLQFPVIDLRQIKANLYHMAGHWDLRIWFFWLDKGTAKRIDKTGLGDKEMDVLQSWEQQQEIPDAERVDLVLDKDLNLRYLCTDLHWHELWAPYRNDLPAHISIAGKNLKDVVIRGSGGITVIAAAQAQSYMPAARGDFDPSLQVMERLRDPDRSARGAGSFEHKHTPYFHNVEFDADLASSDVREG